ncbi:hypothetical protein EVAR_12184_1 [Eumeta japonica]|uniref:Uncharacterized protein n=1 Tax=Eumeta variegata TaxID=151549 RepID=A0A4C1UH24_EUMVA|nr:hypothetical protein EVAR_12184_1 [Eumeta japonica]
MSEELIIATAAGVGVSKETAVENTLVLLDTSMEKKYQILRDISKPSGLIFEYDSFNAVSILLNSIANYCRHNAANARADATRFKYFPRYPTRTRNNFVRATAPTSTGIQYRMSPRRVHKCVMESPCPRAAITAFILQFTTTCDDLFELRMRLPIALPWFLYGFAPDGCQREPIAKPALSVCQQAASHELQ